MNNWFSFLGVFLFLLFLSRVPWEWLGETVKAPVQSLKRLAQTPEEQMLEEIAKIHKKAEEGSASALYDLGSAYDQGWGVPTSKKIAVQYYLKAYEAAVEAAVEQEKWDEWLAKPADEWPAAAESDAWDNLNVRSLAAFHLSLAYNDDEAEKWYRRHDEARIKINDLEKARRQKKIEEHEALIPQ